MVGAHLTDSVPFVVHTVLSSHANACYVWLQQRDGAHDSGNKMSSGVWKLLCILFKTVPFVRLVILQHRRQRWKLNCGLPIWMLFVA